MIDRQLLLRKLDLVRHHAARLRSKLPPAAETLPSDEDLRDFSAITCVKRYRAPRSSASSASTLTRFVTSSPRPLRAVRERAGARRGRSALQSKSSGTRALARK